MVETQKWQVPIRPVRSTVARSPITPVSSSFHKSVCLLDWWVVKPEGDGLMVSGFASTGSGEARLFRSARISKRIATMVLEAVDDIHIILTGLINRSQAHQNGFSNSFCQHFQFGFPCDWEEYSTQLTASESAKTSMLREQNGSSEPNVSSGTRVGTSLAHLDSLPVMKMRDFHMSLSEDSENCMLDCILCELGKISSHTPMVAHSATTRRTRSATRSEKDGTPRSHKKAKVDENDINDDGVVNVRDLRSEGSRNCSSGVMTRAMLKTIEGRGKRLC